MNFQELLYKPDCPSTQDEVKSVLNTRNAPIAIYTDNQTAGYGQHGSDWLCQPGQGLAISIAVPVSERYLLNFVALNKAITYSVFHCLNSYLNKDLQIKWPNDLITQERKLGGLIMNLVKENSILAVGIGINMQPHDQLPKSISLRESTDRNIDLHELARALYQGVLEAQKLNSVEVHNLYKNHLWKLNQEVNLTWGSHISNPNSHATLLDVDKLGRLVLDLDGELASFQHGEVRLAY